MKGLGICPKCGHDDRFISLLPNEYGIYGHTCLKCKHEELRVLDQFLDSENNLCSIDE
jgi:Zn ribbon nucleic-acid-binding protein